VPAEARATKLAARTIEVRILLDLLVFWFKLPKSEGYLRKANDVDVWVKRVWASRTRKEWTTEGQGFAWILKARLEYRKRGKIAALGHFELLVVHPLAWEIRNTGRGAMRPTGARPNCSA
jgi:hypothetical protein